MIDSTDSAILAELTSDGRKSLSEIGRALGLSTATIHNRVERLKEAGIIRGTRVVLDARELGYGLTALVGVHLNRAQDLAPVLTRLRALPEVVEAHYTTGSFGLFLKVVTKDLDAYYRFLTMGLQLVPGVRSTESFMCMATPLERPPALGLEAPRRSRKVKARDR